MSAQNTIDDKQSRRRRRRRAPEEEAEESETEMVVSDARGVTQGKGRATPGRRTQVDEEEEGNVATRTFGGIREYFEGVQSELGKVAWPTREETLRLTGIVLTALVICAIVLGIIGLIYTEIFRIGLDLPIIFVAIVVGAIAVTVFVFWRSNRRSSSPF